MSSLKTGYCLSFLPFSPLPDFSVHKGWLEPLLNSVAADRKTVVSPVINAISDTTFSNPGGEIHNIAIFNMNAMYFTWDSLPKDMRKKVLSDPVRYVLNRIYMQH